MYTVKDGRILEGGSEIQLRGISHFGFNTPILQPQHLWEMGWKQQIEQIKALGFNAVRVPYVPDTLYSQTPLDRLSYVMPTGNQELIGKTPLQALDIWMAEADRLGLYLLLDFHSVSMHRQYPTWYCNESALMYNKRPYSVSDWVRDLVFVAKRYSQLQRFIGIDLYNEPNGVVRWSAGDANMKIAANYWKPAAEMAGAAVLGANPKLLLFVQGIAGNFDGKEDGSLPMNWGEDFQPQAYQPLNIPVNKLVLSPHTYGPDVYSKQSFSAADFPKNLPAQWEKLFGQFAASHAVVIGEWGGRYAPGSKDLAWQNALVEYLISKGMSSSFYWCYSPNSGDTGGILDDKLQVREDKMTLLRRLWAATKPVETKPVEPRPQQIVVVNGTVEISGTFTVNLR